MTRARRRRQIFTVIYVGFAGLFSGSCRGRRCRGPSARVGGQRPSSVSRDGEKAVHEGRRDTERQGAEHVKALMDEVIGGHGLRLIIAIGVPTRYEEHDGVAGDAPRSGTTGEYTGDAAPPAVEIRSSLVAGNRP